MSSPADDTQEIFFQNGLDVLAARFFGPPTPNVAVELAALSHRGTVRQNNEDCYHVVKRRRLREILFSNLPEGTLPEVREETYAMAVADGMGGVAFGELASMLAIRTGWELGSQAFKWNFKITDSEVEELNEKLQVFGRLISRAINRKAAETEGAAGMGTTLTAALIVGSDAIIAHVGDSRAYLFRAGVLQQLTRDHTLAQHLVDKGVFTRIEEAGRFMQHALVNCLGGKHDDVDVNVHRLQLCDGDKLLLCTDGLHDMVSDPEIVQIISQPLPCTDLCKQLVDQALAKGGEDNVTVVLGRIELPTDSTAV